MAARQLAARLSGARSLFLNAAPVAVVQPAHRSLCTVAPDASLNRLSAAFSTPRAIGLRASPAATRFLPPAAAVAHGAPYSTEAGDTEGVDEVLPPRLLVLGGNGFVGSAVCREALTKGLEVVSVNRSGPPPKSDAWAADVEWVKADVLELDAWKEQLEGADAVVSCIGAFGSNEFMRKINGTANVQAVEAAKEAGVERFVFISAHDYKLPGFVLPGYFQGKRDVEDALARHFPTGGVALRLGPIHGTRVLPSGQEIPLGAVFGPLESLMNTPTGKQASESVPVLGALMAPPLSDKCVAAAAVAAATDPAVPSGVMDVWDVAKYS